MKKHTTATPIRARRKPLITALEPRILLDGAALVAMAEMATDVAYQNDGVHSQTAEQSVHFAAPAPTAAEPGNRREVAFVDTSVNDYQSLVAGLGDAVEVVLIDGSANGLEQMVAALQGQSGIDAIHLFSHGAVGELKLGTLTLNADSLPANAELLSSLGESLTESGDLMLYGCYVGADSAGQSFIDSIASMTLADVAASEDLTGAERLGGNWVLEAESGLIETSAAAVAGYDGTLAPALVVSDLSDLTYKEGDGTVLIDGDVSISGSSDYTGGYLDFAIDSATTAESLGFLTDSTPSSASGQVSIVGSTVFRGDGSSAIVIGSVDTIKNGKNGQPLRINFSNAFENGNFQDGTNGSTVIKGWTTVLEKVRLNGVDKIAGQATPIDTTYPARNGSIGDNTSGGNFTKTAYLSNHDGQSGSGDLAIRLNTGASTIHQSYGVIRGPYVYSNSTVSLEAGDKVSFDWKALSGGDAYDAYGYLVDVNTGATITILNATGTSANQETAWATRVTTVSAGKAGDYRFVFVAGSYDLTGGNYVGGQLMIDNVKVTQANPPGPIGDATITAISQRVTYTNTAADYADLTRHLQVSALDKAGNTGSATSRINLVEENNAPSFSGDASLASVNEDTASPAGSSVSALFAGLFVDVDANYDPKDTLAGIIITADASDSAQGQWQYSTDGSNWHAVGSVSADAGLLLASTASLRFVPAADYNGTPGSLSVHAVDSSDPALSFTLGEARATFDTSVSGSSGGITAVSAAAVSLVTSIAAVNDAPVLPTSESTITGATEDKVKTITYNDLLTASAASDVDDGDTISFRIESISSGTLKKDTGSSFVNVTPGTTLLAPGESLLWLPDANKNGVINAFTIKAIDTQSALSTVTQQVKVDVAAVNDPVVITGKSSVTLNEDSSVNISGFSVTDVEGDDVTIRVTANHGNLVLANAGDVSVAQSGGRTLEFSGSLADVNAALNTLRYAGDADYFGKDQLSIEASDDEGLTWQPYRVDEQGLFYNPVNGHYYEYIYHSGITWDAAKDAAEQRVLFGLKGYLATVTSQAENDLIAPKLGGDGWIGASDAEQEGIWKWVTGPEAGTQFWTGDTGAGTSSTNKYGSAYEGGYANWAAGEPNNADASRGGEDVAHFYGSGGNRGTWNDFAATNTGSIRGYIVEYGGYEDEVVQAAQLNITINPVNDAPVLAAPEGATIVDTAEKDTFGTLTGTLTATDIDSSTLTYGIQGGTDDGTYVTLTSTYGALRVTKTTGDYSFTPNSNAINGLNTTEAQTFTVTVSDGHLSDTQTLEFTLEGVNDNPIFAAESGSTQVSVFSYPNLNGNDSTPGSANENANLASIVQWVINEGGQYSLDTSIQNFTDANFADKLNASGFFFMTDMEQFTSSFDPLSDTYLPSSAAETINNWVKAGGVIMMTGTAGTEDVEFLNRVFGWDLTSQNDSNWSLNADNAAGTPFEGGPSSLNAPSATDSIGAGTVDGFKAIYGTADNATVAEISFGAGRVLFLGYDYYDSGIAGTGFTANAPQYGADVTNGSSNTNAWVTEIIPRALEYSANLSSNTTLTETDSTLSTSGKFAVSDADQSDSVSVTVSAVTAEQRNADGTEMTSSSLQPTAGELLAMLDLGSQPVIDNTTTSADVNWVFNSNTETFDYLAAGQSLVLTYQLSADDGNGGSATRTLTITINGVNDAPVAQSVTQEVAENGVYAGNVPAASDVDGTIDAYELVSGISGGTLIFNADGSYSFDPGTAFDYLADGESANVSFTYRAKDNLGAASAAASITLTVVGSNDVPVVSAGAKTAGENERIDTRVPAAIDVDGTIASYQLVTDVASGSLTFNSDGSYRFDPGSDFDDLAVGESRQVNFTYTATDNDGGVSAPGTVTITITGTNDAPTLTVEAAGAITETAGDSSAQALSDSGVVRFNDLDTTDRVTISFASNNDIAWSAGTLDADLTSALVAGFSIPATVNADAPGNVNWAYSVADVNLDFLAAGETLSFSYTITATDSQNATATDKVTFTITGTNDAPTITADAADAITEVSGDSSAQALSDSGVVRFNDLDTTDRVTISFASNNDIAWSAGTLDADLTSALVAGFSIPATVNADAPGSVNWAYAVSSVNLDFLAAGETLSFSYTITATDSQNATATDKVTFTITGTNDAPTLTIAEPEVFAEGRDAAQQSLSQSGYVEFEDVDVNDTLTITFTANNDMAWQRNDSTLVSSLPSALINTLTAGFSTGAENQAHSGQVLWTYNAGELNLDFLNAGDTITFSYTVTVKDSQGATADAVVTVTVLGTNDAPELTGYVLTVAETIVQQGADYQLEAAKLFHDKDSTLSREDLDFKVTGLPAGIRYNPETGAISGKATESGKFLVTVTATDTEGASISRTYEMVVTAVVQNKAPTVAGGTTPIPGPSIDTPPIEAPLSAMPKGLLYGNGASSDPADSRGYMASSTAAASETRALESTADSARAEPLAAGAQTLGSVEQVILSEPGALVIQTQNPDGKTSVRASVDVSVMRDGVVVFTDVQREAFSSVALTVASIERTADKVLVVTIQDTRQTGGAQLYTGSLSSGESLPSWIKLDPSTGSLTLSERPAGQKEVSVRIQTVGSDGQVRVLELNLDLDELFGRGAVTDPAAGEAEQQEPIGFVPLSDQLEAELSAHDNYGDRLMALLQSA